MYDSLTTVRDLIRYAITEFNKARLFFGHGSDNVYDEAVYLVLHSLHLPLDRLEPFMDAHVTSQEKAQCLALIEQRVSTRKPLAYLTGEAWLQGERFISREGVIVPRSPIAELLAERLEPWIEDPDAPLHILDMCTGSGCLAILATKAFPQAAVDAVDICDQALDLAEENIELHAAPVTLIKSNIFSEVPNDDPYDLMICNPPYVNQQSMKNLPAEYLHEPRLALAGGQDGMDFIREFLKQAPDYLTDHGLIVLEIGHEAVHFEQAFPELNFTYLSTMTQEQSIVLIQARDL
ncbi:50S ribosomal protein L3 N(5)-glutamine methyltransferase [Basilea psittacipulmonis]|uniref:SAM-dependent methyltransferase n=1 Tax=Basilea psittacipulmonis DSM 24701 TaxID=1072685 RepID=A0A077DHF5_9BURK|nr:50S ribosomal protein L3 N(5)-glutamine methyltransferase [Basilea psittacipulmonis]AIL32967.1 SAM-dependent methyltransferase [Basilea psittacipulmonis DSM 24701]